MLSTYHSVPAVSAPDPVGATVLKLLHRFAYRLAQGILGLGAMLPLFVHQGEVPHPAGVAACAAFVLLVFSLPKPDRTPEIEGGRRPATRVQRVFRFLI